jgi:hypothetical protein
MAEERLRVRNFGSAESVELGVAENSRIEELKHSKLESAERNDLICES